MGYFKPSRYTIENALREVARYDGIYVGDNYVTKDHGAYIEINIEDNNGKGHVSYNLYFDEAGKLKDWIKHWGFKFDGITNIKEINYGNCGQRWGRK